MESRLQELLAKIKASRFPIAKSLPVTTTQQGAPLNPERRAENLRLLRAFLNADQTEMSELLRLGSQSYYSTVELAKKQLAAGDARRIEKDLDLPDGWFERNNADSLFLSQAELNLIMELRHSDPEATLLLVSAVKAVRVVR